MAPITRRLLDRWSENVGVDIVAQIKSYAADADSAAKMTGPSPYKFGSQAS